MNVNTGEIRYFPLGEMPDKDWVPLGKAPEKKCRKCNGTGRRLSRGGRRFKPCVCCKGK